MGSGPSLLAVAFSVTLLACDCTRLAAVLSISDVLLGRLRENLGGREDATASATRLDALDAVFADSWCEALGLGVAVSRTSNNTVRGVCDVRISFLDSDARFFRVIQR